MVKADENIFRIYLDIVRQLSEHRVYDVYETLDAFQRRLESLSKTSSPAQRYRELVRDLLREDPRKQRRLSTLYDTIE